MIAPIIDILAHEYHWSLQEILALPSGQLKRVLAAFFNRKKMKAKALDETFNTPSASSRSNRKDTRTFDLSNDPHAFSRAKVNKFPLKDI